MEKSCCNQVSVFGFWNSTALKRGGSLIGNYYQYNTATAGSGGTITNANATNSICPKGWKMATSGRDADGKPLLNDGSFAGMLSRYGFEFEEKESDRSGYFAANPNELGYNILTMPWYYVNDGAVYPDFGGYGHGGEWVWPWSSSSRDIRYAYNLFLQIQRISPSGFDDKMYGFSLRYIKSHPSCKGDF